MEPTPNSIQSLAACLLLGAAAASLVYSMRDFFGGWLDFVERDMADKLRRLRTPTRRLRSYLIVWIIVTGCVFAGFFLVAGSIIFAVLMSAFMLCVPWFLLNRMAHRRRQKIEDQLADAMVMFANAVRAGLSLAQSLDVLAAQCPQPICTEFRQMMGEYNMGKPLDETLNDARQRLRSENFALFAAALMASHQSGGRLNEVVERIAQSVLELQRLERKVNSETAQARKSAMYMAIAPVFILIAYYFVDPINTKLLFVETAGQFLLAGALILNVVAYFWAQLILNPDI